MIGQAFALLCALLSTVPIVNLNAQQRSDSLDRKQRAIVEISAFTASGKLVNLEKALNGGLNAGLTVNEIKEILIQLYAYAGFPRSLNALNAFSSVLKSRKAQGIKDLIGKEATPLRFGKNKLAFGTEMQTKLVGRPVTGEVFQFAPAIDMFLKEHLFGDIFGRDNLDWKTRELATVAALSALGNVESQLGSHLKVGKYNGLSERQLNEALSIVGGLSSENNSRLFPKGDKIINNNFAGNAWLEQLTMADSVNHTQVGSVTFEPRARTNWHLHPDGQILLAIDGIGYYQEQGQPKKLFKKGQTIKCPPNTPHWHGAAEDSQLIQLAITSAEKGSTVWLQPVTDKEYLSGVKAGG